jgi:NTP pyrophosphatase (non-canonical NTP hydrolase)
MFAFGDKEWPGISKLVEECGEVVQIVGKLIQTRGKTKHWNVPDLKAALEDELSDVWAALTFVQKHCDLDANRMADRIVQKLDLFEKWHAGENDPIE